MTFGQAMHSLESAGTAQNRKIYARHGVDGPMFGVSYAHLGKLARQIKRDQPLALALWKTGNHDARILATMVADPAEMKVSQLKTWARSLDNNIQAGALAKLAGQCDGSEVDMRRWIDDHREVAQVAGWSLAAGLAMQEGRLSDETCVALLAEIERDIAGAKNQTRYAMNNALIAIGGRGGRMKDRAVAVARRIGKVEVDHGETGCKTPDAETYINRMMKRRGC